MNQNTQDKAQKSTPIEQPNVIYSVSLSEIVMLERVRKCEHGIIEVHKFNGHIQRTIYKVNELVHDEDGQKILDERKVLNGSKGSK